jgi:two-component sensor histidine kinase
MMNKLTIALGLLLFSRPAAGRQSSDYLAAYKRDSLHHNYRSAVENHIRYTDLDDSTKKAGQQLKMEQLLVKYSTQKKDRDIRLLQERQLTEQARIKQNRLTRGMMITGAGILLFIIILLYRAYRIKRRGNAAIANSNRRLQELIREKEWLLKEVHHRVKNNLHTIICLLESQSRYLQAEALNAMEISQHRIYAVSLVHQHLYQSADISSVDMPRFIREYIQYITEALEPDDDRRLVDHVGPVKLDVMHAVPVALIVNETVINLLAGDLAAGDGLEIRIGLHQVGERSVLQITDHRAAGSAGFRKERYASSSLTLIRGLVDSIGGELTIGDKNGLDLKVIFNRSSNYNRAAPSAPPKEHRGLTRTLLTVLAFGLAVFTAYGQTPTAKEAVKNYSLPQKRLLVVNTLQFANFISQNNLDQDSLTAMACRLTGMPFLLPYLEGIGADSGKRIPLLLESAMRLLHRPGTRKQDLDSAGIFVDSALRAVRSEGEERWNVECAFLQAELYRQRGDIQQGRRLLIEMRDESRKRSDPLNEARACRELAGFTSDQRLAMGYRTQALHLYRQLRMPEGQIEMLMDIVVSRATSESIPREKLLRQILSIMEATGFRHRLFVENFLAYTLLLECRYVEGLEMAKAALADVNGSGIEGVEGSFWIRLGSAYEDFQKMREALDCFNKALAAGTAETHIFWYKSLFYAATLMNMMDDGKGAIALIDTVTAKFPPITPWEKLQVISMRGECYDQLHQVDSADKYYMALLRFDDEHPHTDTYGEFSSTYWEIAKFYISIGDVKKAALFAAHAAPGVIYPKERNFMWYQFRFKMDSATGDFRSALRDHILYKEYHDSTYDMEQLRLLDEITVRYDAEKKDQAIRILKQQSIMQQAQLRRDALSRALIIGTTLSLLLIAALLFSQYRVKRRHHWEMRRKNHLLQALIDEKAWLLKEVQLRVKENLQTVISLLSVQATDLQDDALKAIENSRRRIYAMSLIHKKLYESEGARTVDMSHYVPELVHDIESGFGLDPKIRFELDIHPVFLDATHAVAVGMIINEAATNAVKYAFPGGGPGTIRIRMTKVLDMITLAISDNGLGMPMPASPASTKRLGMKLMQGLSDDIGATLTIAVSQGTTILLKMKYPGDAA